MSLKTMLAAAALFGAVLGQPAAASAVFDFEGFANNVTINSLTAGGITATVTGTERKRGPADVRIFDTLLATNVPNDPDLVSNTIAGGQLKSSAFGNVLIIQESDSKLSPDDSRFGGTITFAFDRAVDLLSFALIDDAKLTVSSPGKVSINQIVGTNGGFATRAGTPLFAGITELSFRFAQSGAIDNIIVAPAAIPVPAALPLLLAGMGALGIAARRKRA